MRSVWFEPVEVLLDFLNFEQFDPPLIYLYLKSRKTLQKADDLKLINIRYKHFI